METLVSELKKNVRLKKTTQVGDVVLVMVEEPQSLFYAMVTDIEPDLGKREEWWNVHLSILSIPPQPVVWTLREAQFTGQEIFSMGNVGRFIQAVDLSNENDRDAGEKSPVLSPVSKSKKTKKSTLRRIK